MNLHQLIHQRYAAKKYNPNKKIPAEQIEQIIELLQYTPTSLNTQPYHFILTGTPAGKGRIAKSMEPDIFAYNRSKIIDSSHGLVICSKTTMDRAYIAKTLEKAHQDGRIDSLEKVQQLTSMYANYVTSREKNQADLQTWMGEQCFIALGNLLLGAAILGIDTTPIGGYDNEILDKEFDLASLGYKSLVVIALGYRADDDSNAKLPKSRLTRKDLFTFC